MSKRFLIISSGNEGTDTALMLRHALVAEYQKLEAVPAALRWLALNTDDPRDEKYPIAVRLKEPEKLALKVSNVQTIAQETTHYHHLTQDLPTACLLSQDTTRGSARIPSQGELSLRYYHEEFVARLRLMLQQLYDPKVFPDAGELCVIVMASGCTGTGRGTALEILVEVKRQLVASRRGHRILAYILSPEGLSPDDLAEKQKVFYAFLKELNGVAMGKPYLRPFLADPKAQTWTGFPADYVFLVSACSESIHLASLHEMKQVVVYHLLYELTSTAGTRMESARRDCISRLRGVDGYGQPTFLSRLGLAMIDLPVRAFKQLCLAQGGIDLCQTLLGEPPETMDTPALVAAAGLSLSQVTGALGQPAALSRLSAIWAQIQQELSTVRPSQWGGLITTHGAAKCEAMLSQFRQSMSKRLQIFIKEKMTQLEAEAKAHLTAFGQPFASLKGKLRGGVYPTLARLKALQGALGVHEGGDGLIQQVTHRLEDARNGEEREEEGNAKGTKEIRRCRQRFAEAQRGILARLGLNPPTEARDQLIDALKAYYQSEVALAVAPATLEVYRSVGTFLVGLIQQIEAVATPLETAKAGFQGQLETYTTADEFPLAEYLIPKDDYKRLYDDQIGSTELETMAQDLLAQYDGDVFAISHCAAEGLMERITDGFHRSKRFDFLSHLSFSDSFQRKYPEAVTQEGALRRAFERAAPLTLADANYPHSTHGVAPEAHQLVLVPQDAAAHLSPLVLHTHPIAADGLLAVPEKRMLILREEHGWPVSALPYLRDECAASYKADATAAVQYHISQWAADYPDPMPIHPMTGGKLTAADVLLLAMGLGVLSQEDGNFSYRDGPIPVPLGDTFEAALEALETDASPTGESDYDALSRLTFQRERQLIRTRELETVFGVQAALWVEFARPLRDLFHKRYGA